MGSGEKILSDIVVAWNRQDREEFRFKVDLAVSIGVSREAILEAITGSPVDVDEDFEQWGYMYIASEGASECTPG